jgi:membrane-bound metal-dependent hydrolase YbcI (DUF457 family)
MFVGHLSVALAAKRAAPNASLGWLVGGATALDLIWPVFILLGIEKASITPGVTAFTPITFDSYPWSHSLMMSVVWGLVLVTIARAARVPASPVLLVALVVSHWVLDFIAHAPDMPLWPGSERFGLTLWNSIPGTLLVEGAMWVAGIAIYMGVLARNGQRPGWWFWSFVIVCTVMWATSPYSPPPPSVQVLGWFGLIGWIIIPWSALADRRRRPKSTR